MSENLTLESPLLNVLKEIGETLSKFTNVFLIFLGASAYVFNKSENILLAMATTAKDGFQLPFLPVQVSLESLPIACITLFGIYCAHVLHFAHILSALQKEIGDQNRDIAIHLPTLVGSCWCRIFLFLQGLKSPNTVFNTVQVIFGYFSYWVTPTVALGYILANFFFFWDGKSNLATYLIMITLFLHVTTTIFIVYCARRFSQGTPEQQPPYNPYYQSPPRNSIQQVNTQARFRQLPVVGGFLICLIVLLFFSVLYQPSPIIRNATFSLMKNTSLDLCPHNRFSGSKLNAVTAERGPNTVNAEVFRGHRIAANDRLSLNRARFDNATILHSSFAGAFLDNASFKDAVLQGSCFAFSNNLSSSTSAKTSDDLHGESLLNFDGADLSNADFSYTTFRNATFIKASFENVVLSNSEWVNTNFSDATGLNTIKAYPRKLNKALFKGDLTNVEFRQVSQLNNITFRECHARALDMSGCFIQTFQISESEFNTPENNFSNLHTTNGTFVKVSMIGTNLSTARIRRSIFFECPLNRADFTDAILDDTVFSGGSLKKARFHHASLKSTIFHNVDLSKAQFQDTDLSKTIFDDNQSFKDICINECTILPPDLEPFREEILKAAPKNCY